MTDPEKPATEPATVVSVSIPAHLLIWIKRGYREALILETDQGTLIIDIPAMTGEDYCSKHFPNNKFEVMPV